MKLLIDPSILKYNSDFVGVAIKDRTSHPIFTNILFTIDPKAKTLTLTGSDNDTFLTAVLTIPEQPLSQFGDHPLSIAVPYKIYKNVIGALSNNPMIDIDIQKNKGSSNRSEDENSEQEQELFGYLLTFSSLHQQFTIHCFDGEEYPEPPTTEAITEISPNIEVPANPFLSSLAQIKYAMSTNTSQPQFCAVQLTFAHDHYRAYSTDGHRLCRYVEYFSEPIELEEGEFESVSFLLPSQNIPSLIEFCKDSENPISFAVSESSGLLFAIADRKQAVFRTLSYPYPRREQLDSLIPAVDQCPFSFSFDRKALLSNLKPLTTFSGTNAVRDYVNIRVLPDQGEVLFSSAEKQIGEAQYTLITECESATEPYPLLTLRLKYFIEALSSIPDTVLKLCYSAPNKMVLLSPASSLSTDETVRHWDASHVLMPIDLKAKS